MDREQRVWQANLRRWCQYGQELEHYGAFEFFKMEDWDRVVRSHLLNSRRLRNHWRWAVARMLAWNGTSPEDMRVILYVFITRFGTRELRDKEKKHIEQLCGWVEEGIFNYGEADMIWDCRLGRMVPLTGGRYQ